MAATTDWNFLEMNASQRPFDYSQPNSRLSWEDFSTFYKTANHWDYPVEVDQDPNAYPNGQPNPNSTSNTNTNVNTTQSQPHTNDHDAMFRNRGSRQSMDILADNMNKQWSFTVNNKNEATDNTETQNSQQSSGNPSPTSNLSLPDNTTIWNNTLSNTAQASNITESQRMAANFMNHNNDGQELNNTTMPLQKTTSMTDSQGIDIADDTQIIIDEINSKIHDEKEKEIKQLKEYINKIEIEKQELLQQNESLKKRNSELRKALNKATQYRRKSSIAVANLMNINDKLTKFNKSEHMNMNINNNKNEEKVREEEELDNLKIQEQIQQAIAMFQEEFGAELDEELNNIDSFQYESLPDESPSDHARDDVIHEQDDEYPFNDTDPLYKPTKSSQLIGTQRQNTINPEYNKGSQGHGQKKDEFTYGALGVDFRIKFTDAHSNSNIKENDSNNNNDNGKGGFIEDPTSDDDGDALPETYEATPGGPNEVTVNNNNIYVTPGGPDMDSVDTETTENESIELENGYHVPINNGIGSMNQNGIEITVNAKANDTKLKEMELRLNNLSEKILGLMERIQDLTDRNQQLELSKLELITNTSTAMNEYRDTIKRLSETNNILLTKIRAR